MKKVLRLIGIGIVGLFVAGVLAFHVFDGRDYFDYIRAEEARDREDYAATWVIMMPLAEKGFALAQLRVGQMYYDGDGVPQNTPEALKWLKRSARQGDLRAMGYLAFIYRVGVGLEQDPVEAYKWLSLALEEDPDDANLINWHILLRESLAYHQISESWRRIAAWKAGE